MEKLRISDGGKLLDALKKATRDSSEVRYYHRLHCLLLVAQGHSCPKVAEWFGISSRSLERWVHDFEKNSLDGLKDTPKAGRPGRIKCTDIKALKQDLKKAPCYWGYDDTDTWHGKQLQKHLKQRYSIFLSERQCQRLLKQLQ